MLLHRMKKKYCRWMSRYNYVPCYLSYTALQHVFSAEYLIVAITNKPVISSLLHKADIAGFLDEINKDEQQIA